VVARAGQVCPASLDAIMATAGLVAAVRTSRYCLYLSEPDHWARLDGGRGIVVGDLFARDDVADVAALSGGRVAASAGDFAGLLRNYWGGYVAMSQEDRHIQVLRDPSGALPAYYVERDDGWYVASDAPLLAEAGCYSPVIDWDEIAWFFYTNGFPGESTALAGLRQIIPGTAVSLPPDKQGTSLLWSPWTHIAAPDRGPDALRYVATQCMRAWQIRHGRIVAGVSGGLDSSIVACGLDREEVTALTISTGDAQGDETPYAEALCSVLDIPLERARYALEAIDIARPSLAHRPFPGGMAQLQAYDAVVIESVRRQGAAAFFSGVGGDNIFQLTQSARPLVDRLMTDGLTSGLFSTLQDICKLTGARTTTVLREAARVPRRPGPKYRWPTDRRLLTPEITARLNARPFDHPWLEAPQDCLPGKHAHVAMILRAHAYLECHDRRWPFASVHPLMSQPILELALATPSWVACEGGVDRARARRAFMDVIPASVLHRRLKGGPDGFASQIMQIHREAIREILLDGRLVREHLVDRDSLEQALTESALMRGHNYARLLQLLDAEAWAHHWLSVANRSKAMFSAWPPISSPPIASPQPRAADPPVACPVTRT
ncbi:MAG: asparagine synthase-related protein, partial [Sphingomonas sp.]